MATATCPVVTAATVASDDDLREACAHFLSSHASELSFTKCSSGVNNRVYLVTDASSSKHCVRIYNNGANTPRVAFEHELLLQLPAKRFSFATPVPLPIRGAGAPAPTFALLSSGAAACVFNFIPGGGVPSTPIAAHAIGRATAELVRGLESAIVTAPAANPQYRNMWAAHHSITRASYLAAVSQPQFDAVRSDVDVLTRAVLDAEERLIPLVLSARLPEQIIHADAHSDNFLADVTEGGVKVTGVLDFEFAVHDWRAMELVVCLSKYAGLASPEACFQACIEGYAAGGGRLLAREIGFISDLIMLRILNNVVYFVGRGLAGEDSYEPLTGRAGVYVRRCAWLASSREWLEGILTAALLQPEAE